MFSYIKWTLSSTLLLSAISEPGFTIPNRAYVTNVDGNSVSVIDTNTNTIIGAPIPVGINPRGLAITPDEAFVYVANSLSDTVSVIDTATNTVIAVVPVGNNPHSVAITPNGLEAWVVNTSDLSVTRINTTTNMIIPPVIGITGVPRDIVFDPSGSFAYLSTESGAGPVCKVSTITNMQVAAAPFAQTFSIGITPDGMRVYLPEFFSDQLQIIDAATLMAIGPPISIGITPYDIAFKPDGSTAYTANRAGNTVSVIDTTTFAVSSVSLVGMNSGVAVTSDGAFAYVTTGSGIGVIDTATNTVVETIPSTISNFPFKIELTRSIRVPPVTDLTGIQRKEDSGLEYQLFNRLEWNPISSGIAGFYVYRDGIRIAILGANTFTYTDNNRKKSVTTAYSVIAFDENNIEGPTTTVVVKGL